MERQTHKIDATDRILGRLASEIAVLLRGKHKPNFVPYFDGGDFVLVNNAEKIKLSGKKVTQKTYFSHSGYLGHEKLTPLLKLFKKDPNQILKRAVWGMLPKNKLRKEQIKRLKFK